MFIFFHSNFIAGVLLYIRSVTLTKCGHIDFVDVRHLDRHVTNCQHGGKMDRTLILNYNRRY